MSSFKGIIGKISDDLFHDGAKIATETKKHTYTDFRSFDTNTFSFKTYDKNVTSTKYKLTDKLGKYVGAGTIAGTAGSVAMNTYNNHSEGKSLSNNILGASLRGAALGSFVGAGVNVAPKIVVNNLKKSGIQSFDGAGEMAADVLNVWSPVIEEVSSMRKASRKDKTVSPVDKMLKLIGDSKKELKQEKDHSKAGLALKMHNKALNQLDPDNLFKKSKDASKQGFTAEDLVRLESMNQKIKTAGEGMSDLRKTSPRFDEFVTWSSETGQDLGRLDQRTRSLVGASLLGQMGFKSAYHHIVEPTSQFFSNIKNGKFKDINFTQVAATAFSGYGLYETGAILNDTAEGNLGGVLTGAAMLAGGKIAFGMAMDLSKLEAERLAKGISTVDMFKTGKAIFASKAVAKSSSHMTDKQKEEVAEAYVEKIKEVVPGYVKNLAPNTFTLAETYKDTHKDKQAMFKAGIQLAMNGTVTGAGKEVFNYAKKVPYGDIYQASKNYSLDDYENLVSMASKLNHSNKEEILEWGTKYSKTLAQLEKDLMNPNLKVDYGDIVNKLKSEDNKDQLKGAYELARSSKAFQKLGDNLPGKQVEPGTPIYKGLKDPVALAEFGGLFALGTGTTYGVDYAINGEDASVTNALLLGGGLHLAAGAHIIGNRAKYFAKTT